MQLGAGGRKVYRVALALAIVFCRRFMSIHSYVTQQCTALLHANTYNLCEVPCDAIKAACDLLLGF